MAWHIFKANQCNMIKFKVYDLGQIRTCWSCLQEAPFTVVRPAYFFFGRGLSGGKPYCALKRSGTQQEGSPLLSPGLLPYRVQKV